MSPTRLGFEREGGDEERRGDEVAVTGCPRVRRALAVALVLVGGLGLPAGADDTVPDGTSPPTASNNAAAAQPLTVSGHVRTTAGAPIAGATVSGGEAQPTTTDASGFYRLQFLTFGTKQVTATAPGMNSRSNLVALSLEQAVVDGNDYTLRYLTSVVLNRSHISTASASFTLTQTLSTYAPASACASVRDSRTAAITQLTLSSSGSQATGTYTGDLAQGSPEGVFTLTSSVADCATGTQLDVGATATYVVDNTAPVLSQPIPANWGNSTTPNPVISAFAGDNLAGIDAAAVSLSLDGSPVPSASVGLTPVGASAVLSYQAQGLSMGLHGVVARAVDRAGNRAADLAWDFLVVNLSLASAAARPDPGSVGTVPLAYAPGQAISIETAVQVDAATIRLSESGHPGFGVVCGPIDLSGLRARFTKVDGSTVFAAPQNLQPSTQLACTYVVVPDHDVIVDHAFTLASRSYALGALTFPIPTGAMPGSSVALLFEGPSPQVSWQAPCPQVNAAPGVSPPVLRPVCDPVPNEIDAGTGVNLFKHLASRRLELAARGYRPDAGLVLPSVWRRASERWVLDTQPLDIARLHPASPLDSTVTAASPYAGSGTQTYATLVRVTDRWVKEAGPTAREVVFGSYFGWTESFAGASGSTSYLASTFAGGRQRAALEYRVWDASGADVTGVVDDGGRGIAWLAHDDAGGAALGFTSAFTSGGSTKTVLEGQLDVYATEDTGCATCAIAAQWFQVADGRAQAFARRDPGPGLTHTGPAGALDITELTFASASPGCTGLEIAPTAASSSAIVCGGSGSGDPDADYVTPNETSTFYIREALFNTRNLTNRCTSGSPQDLNQSNCNVLYSMGWYAATTGTPDGHYVLFVASLCRTADGFIGFSLWGTCTSMSTVIDGMKKWVDGWYDNPLHRSSRVRFTVATNNSYLDSVVPNLDSYARGMYDYVFLHLREYALSRARSSAYPFPRISGGMDFDTRDDGSWYHTASETLPFHAGWNRQAIVRSNTVRLNMYAVNSLTLDFQCWECATFGWTAHEFWHALWGKGNPNYAENFSIPQNYTRVRPPYYVTLNARAVEGGRGRIRHSGVAWGCHLPFASTGNPNHYVDSADSYSDFTNRVGQVRYGDAPYYRLLVHAFNYSC